MKGLQAFFYREWLLFSRSKLDIGMSLMLPLITLLFFSLNMGGIVGEVQGVPYVQFLLPGIAAMAVVNNAIGAASRTFNEGYSSIVTELMSMPASRTSYVFAKVVLATILATVQSCLFLFGGSVMFSISLGVNRIWVVFIGTALIGLGVVGLFISIALCIKDMGTYLVVSNLAGQVMLWTSTIFYPSETMPPILRWVSLINPLSHGVDVLRGTINYTPIDVFSWGYLIGFSSIFGVVALRLLAKRNEMIL